MNMDNEWKYSLRERFSNYSAPEPEGLWEGIEQGMAGKPRRKMLPVWLLTGLAAAAAVALVVFLPTRKTMEPDVLQRHDDLAAVLPADTSFLAPTGNLTADLTTSSSLDASSTSSPTPTGNVKAGKSSTQSVPFAVVSRQTLLSEAGPAPSVPVTGETVQDAVHQNVPIEEIPANQEQEEEISDQVGHDEVVPFENTPAPVAKRRRFSIGAYHEGGGDATLETSQGVGLARTGEYLTRSMPDSDVQGGRSSMMNMLSSNRESTYWATHRAPVRVGVTAAWPLTEHLSLVSGLTWTSLSSHFNESTEGDTRMSGTQELGYLGVPLRLEAGWEPVKRLRLYAGAGGMVEKGLLATVKADSYLGNQESTTMTRHPDMGGLLWSVGAEAGAEYRFGKVFGVYFAPGVEYHFDNGAEVRSAYTEKPLHWNVDLGVRFHFGN